MTFPVVSLTDFELDNPPENSIKNLNLACKNHGFFLIENDYVDQKIIDSAFTTSINFFSLNASIKQEYGHHNQKVYPKTARGHVGLYGETLNLLEEADYKECFDLGIDRPIDGRPFIGPTYLPPESVAPGFASSILELQAAILSEIIPRLVEAFAYLLGDGKDFFRSLFLDPTLIQRVIHYPSLRGQAGKHTDNGFFTVLLVNDPEPSLSVYTQGKWQLVPIVPKTFVINIGDMFQFLTDGLFVSPPHTVNHGGNPNRISMPFFVCPSIDSQFFSLKYNKSIIPRDIMLKNFESIWEDQNGARRASELS